MRQEGEPSVEEILESIKKVIARDNRASMRDSGSARQARVAAETHSDDQGDEILDLHEADAVPDHDDSMDHDESSATSAESPLTNDQAASAMRESLAALAMLSQPSAPPQIVRSGETSLEGMVRDMLRPMLARWLDDNLPEMVEKLVKAEISRIAGKQG
ncbi:DUF2497 domain-containing protein [Altericroceibacterium endophyticum]|uniref:DUF2497 domain-containing protein n=1 Tax=Altericroceibacterium endophyticum TaxID=1808508 RepID=A0A6I4T6K2_9SPHN|nr:DUF2497 domain-containing protein [Altericroceibacterium endophyticum]MXO65633.1 DUF2497 domain-containing protein [Altericroceibacterium endophyticum]